MSRKRTTAQVTAMAIAIAMAAAPAAAGTSRIVNGVTTFDFPTTGALLYNQAAAPITASTARSWCSGTLVGCQTFLTAAHCVVDDTAPSHYWVFLQNGGIATVSSITYNPAYNPNLAGRDVAVLKLSAPVTGIDPTTINSTHDLAAMGVGLAGTIAGYGRTGGGSDYGVLHAGDIVTADCTGTEGNDKLVCFDYAAPIGAPGTDSDTCNGDSGGPMFMDFAGQAELVGVTSGGSSLNCQATDHSYDASVYYNAAWIAGQIGADSTAACGSIPPVGDPAVQVFGETGTLDSGHTSDSYEVTLSGTPQLVRFTLGGIDSGFNPNFFVKQGPGASASSYDCKADASSAWGACSFDNPAAGTWSIFVQRGSGSGQYQVTTTVFGGTPATCGNDVKEQGEECDGTDLGTCPVGPCVACSCPAPVCGNDVVESGETCDGSSDAACPGACQGDCTCPTTCTSGDLETWTMASDDRRFLYKGFLVDPMGSYQSLDPRAAAFTLDATDGSGSVSLAIPPGDPGWIKADPVRRKFGWKGDGSNDGLRRVKLVYRDGTTPYWKVLVRGKLVPGAAGLDVSLTLDLDLGFDGTCNLQTW